jgi:threonine-phosphate decarboxylase
MKNFHGGRIYDKSVEVDFSINVNPLGMPDRVKQSIVDNIDNFEVYPDSECLELRQKIATMERVPFENIVCGNGADDLIFRISHVLKPKRCLLLAPTFSDYETSLEGCEVTYYRLREDMDFKVQNDILDHLHDVDVFYLCNPNNPTGTLLDDHLYKLIADRCATENITLIVDECFLDFTLNGKTFKPYLSQNLDLIILKAFTKTYAMAGIRLGYAMFSRVSTCEKVARCGQSWGVSTVAQVCGLSALQTTDYLKLTREYIQQEKDYLLSNFERLNLKFYPTDTNYILVKTPVDLYSKLLDQKILIRPCANYIGLDETYFRLAIKRHSDNVRLVNALENIFLHKIGGGSFE